MKAIEKDRARRYETASSFAADVERFLHDQPIEARPPSQSYRIRKFVHRNKRPVAAVAAVSLALIVGILGTTWGMLEATRNATRATNNAALANENAQQLEQKNVELEHAQQEIEAQNSQLIEQRRKIIYDLLDQAFVHAMSGDEVRTSDLIRQLETLDAPQAEVEMVEGLLSMYGPTIKPTKALEHFRHATELNPESVAAWSLLQDLGAITQTKNDAARKLEQLSPTTHLDHLFLGIAKSRFLGWEQIIEAIPLLEKSIELRDSAFARHWLATTLSAHAVWHAKDWNEMMRACDNVQTARGLVGKSAVVAFGQMTVFDNAVCLARQLKKDEVEIQRLITAASEGAAFIDADLAKRSGAPIGHLMCAKHFDWVEGDVEKARSYWERSLTTQDGKPVVFVFSILRGLFASSRGDRSRA